MKKVLMTVAIAATLGFVSCGGGADVCGCMKMGEDMAKEMTDAAGDADKIKEIQESYKDQTEECAKMGEGKSADELAEMAAAMEEC